MKIPETKMFNGKTQKSMTSTNKQIKHDHDIGNK